MEQIQQNENYEPISQKLIETALKKLHRAAMGNGVEQENVKIKSYDGGVHVFETKTILHLKAVLAKRTEPGKNSTAIPIKTEAEINHKAASRIHNAVNTPSTRDAIIETYTKTDATKGFAAKAVKLPLETLKQDYVLHQDCPACHKEGKLPCQHCKTTGKRVCEVCNGAKQTICQHCNGQCFIHIAGKGRQNCPHCNATGKINCYKCHGHGIVPCEYCKSHGHVPCQKCASSGYFSVINHFEAEAISSFSCDDQHQLPQEISKYLVNERMRALFADHAKLTKKQIKDDDLAKQMTAESTAAGADHDTTHKSSQEDLITIPFEVRCPLAQMVISYDGIDYEGKILGYKPLFLDFEPFIEKSAQKGINNLRVAAKNRSESISKLRKATEFALIKETLTLTLKNSNANSFRQMKRIYPVGVQEKTMKMLITLVRRTLKNITFLPRLLAMLIGLSLSIAAYIGYMLAGGDNIVPETMWKQNELIGHLAVTGLQASPLIITYALSGILAKIKTRRSLAGLLPDSDLNTIKVSSGKMGLLIPLIYISAAALICEFMVDAESLPLWFSMIRQHIPL